MVMVSLFEDARAIDSLRNSDFDAVSAYGEVIDNSIQAEAKNIHINFFKTDGNRGYEHIERILFGDDGTGMDRETLHQCLKIGWSSRFNNRKGIGRFGVGMTMAAIHECKRIEIYSKIVNGEWLRTYVDLDEISQGNMETIPEPTEVALPNEYKEMVGENQGTLVIWSKYDRQEKNARMLIEESEIWIGRTYRHFIWDDGVEVYLNGKLVPVIDPLYNRTEKTRFPGDPSSDLAEDISFNYPVSKFDAPSGAPEESEIVIRLSLLPEEFRPEMGAGGSRKAKERFIDENEGVSILRNRREVFYGHIPHWKSAWAGWAQWDDKDRWWGGEIHFDAVLDRAFTVKNIKRGANPVPELKKMIKREMIGTRHSFLKEVDRVWKEARVRKRTENQPVIQDGILERSTAHIKAETIASATPTDQHEIDRERDFNEEAEKFIEHKIKDESDQKKAAYKTLFASQPFTIMEKNWRGAEFFEASHLGGKSVLEYNMGHYFFEKVYGAIESLEEEDVDAAELVLDLKAMIDLLLIAFAKSEARFSPEMEMSSEQFIELFRTNWGQYLKSYLMTWEKEKERDELQI